MKTSSSSSISTSSIMTASSTVLLKLLRTGVVPMSLRVVEVLARLTFSLDLRLFGWEDFSPPARQVLFCWMPREFEGTGTARKEIVGLLGILSLLHGTQDHKTAACLLLYALTPT